MHILKQLGRQLLPVVIAIAAGGCFSGANNVEVVAVRAICPVEVDGWLDDEVWRHAPQYTFNCFNEMCRQNGTVQFAWDDRFIYVGARLDDDDVMAFCDRDQEHLYTSGDLLEVFLKPASETWYWEIYANPKNARASFFFPGGGRALVGDFDRREHLMENLKVCASIDGTLNDWSDRDKGWTVEMAIPVTELTRFGAEVKAGSVWRFLIGRYNYSRWLEECEISGITRFKNGNRSFHHQPSFGFIKFLPAEAGGYSAFSTR